jgi:WD40 repeat protein
VHLQDYIYLHKEHNDWVTKIQWIPELGLVTSSLDATVKTFDINRSVRLAAVELYGL